MTAGWRTHRGRAAVLERSNIDTDQLIPARFMSTPRSEGYGDFLLYDVRRNEDSELDPAFPLNTAEGASVLITGPNFGSGSSREAAVYALVDAGFAAVIASSFGDIFANNAVNNGLLPARMSHGDAGAVAHVAQQTGEVVEIDLQKRSICVADHMFHFDLPEDWQTKLVNGWDDIDLTLQHRADIDSFVKTRPAWATPHRAS